MGNCSCTLSLPSLQAKAWQRLSCVQLYQLKQTLLCQQVEGVPGFRIRLPVAITDGRECDTVLLLNSNLYPLENIKILQYHFLSSLLQCTMWTSQLFIEKMVSLWNCNFQKPNSSTNLGMDTKKIQNKQQQRQKNTSVVYDCCLGTVAMYLQDFRWLVLLACAWISKAWGDLLSCTLGGHPSEKESPLTGWLLWRRKALR